MKIDPREEEVTIAGKSTTDTCCLTLPLTLEQWQSDRLEKRFEIARQIYNTLLNYELKKLHSLEHSEEYSKTQKEIQERLKDENRDTERLEILFQERNRLRREAGFTEYGFKNDIKDFYKCFNVNIGSSVAVHGIAPQVWDAFEKYFYGEGEKMHFKKSIRSLRGYSITGKSGGAEIIFRGTFIDVNSRKTEIRFF